MKGLAVAISRPTVLLLPHLKGAMLNLIRSVDFQINLSETDLLSSISHPTNGIGNLKSPVFRCSLIPISTRIRCKNTTKSKTPPQK